MNQKTPRSQNPQRLRVFAQRSAAVGVVLWLLLVLAVTTDSHETELMHKVVFFAMLVIVPLGLSLVMADEQTGSLGLYRLAVLVQPIAAIVTVASFFFEKGTLSAALSKTYAVKWRRQCRGGAAPR